MHMKICVKGYVFREILICCALYGIFSLILYKILLHKMSTKSLIENEYEDFDRYRRYQKTIRPLIHKLTK